MPIVDLKIIQLWAIYEKLKWILCFKNYTFHIRNEKYKKLYNTNSIFSITIEIIPHKMKNYAEKNFRYLSIQMEIMPYKLHFLS